jgi:DNA (cytosine-5)-methyltransferase 1
VAEEMTAASLCAGVGAFELALQRAGIRTAVSVEIDRDCRGVLARHFPDATLLNDMTEVTGDQLRAAGFVPGRGITTAGWPCQGNSRAGLQQGMDDPRSGLWRHVVRILGEARPRWFIGENVPRLLTIKGGRDFGVILRDLDELGYGVAWRVFDASRFGLAQRRKRLLIVGCLGDGAAPAQVLFEPDSGSGDPAPSSTTPAGPPGGRAGSARDGGRPADRLTVSTLQGGGKRGHRIDAEGAAGGHLVPVLDDGRIQIRRLTPREWEQLQGLPEITKALRIEVHPCFGHPRNSALAGSLNLKSQKSALDADAPEPHSSAQSAGSHSQCSRRNPELPVAASAHINFEANTAEIRSPDGKNWSVSGVASNGLPRLAALFDVSARLFAPTPQTPDLATSTGRAASPPSHAPSTRQPSGVVCVLACGLEIGGAVGAACESGLGEVRHSTSIMLQVGHSTQHSGSTWPTLCCSVLDAIGSFIPLPTPEATSYAVELTTSAGWTRWTADGREQSDSARYRQVGNSLPVPVATWIARRIIAVEARAAGIRAAA